MILEADNIVLSFGDKKILSGIYLKAETEKVTGILGRNGCGKTSLLRIIFGDLNSKYRNIRINTKYQKSDLYKTSTVAYLPQHQLLPKNIKLIKAFSLFEVDWSNFVEQFASFSIYKNFRTNKLSSGERRVVETYLVLYSGKDIILLDEPFSFIAPLYIEKFKRIINQKKKEAVIVITDHFYRDILEVSDSVYFLKDGYSKIIKSKEDLEREGYLNIS